MTSLSPTGAISTPRGPSTSTVLTEVAGANRNVDSCNRVTQAMISIKTVNADTFRQEGGRSSDVVRSRIYQAMQTILDVKADVTDLRDLTLECSGFGATPCDLLFVVNLLITRMIPLLTSLLENEMITNPKREEERKAVENYDIREIKLLVGDIQTLFSEAKLRLHCGAA